ncbi:MAG: 50S ribosome-binding GTPase, partial [Eubacterium sp.]|nr:50S ribosome-binding GTPase [Eubacterium sp.]
MSMNQTPGGERIHIAIFGRRNAGKSSLINAITGQDLAIVSEVKGTTTDPVYKAMEILPLGPVMLIDTPGLDDEGVLGAERIKKARSVLNKTDLALLVADGAGANTDFSFEEEILELAKKKEIPV